MSAAAEAHGALLEVSGLHTGYGASPVLHGVELLVGLHRHDLFLVFLIALLRGDQVLVDGAALVLIVGEGLLGGGEGGGGGLQEGVERCDPPRCLGNGFVGHRRPAFNLLQLD